MTSPGFMIDATRADAPPPDPEYDRLPVQVRHVLAAAARMSGYARADIISQLRKPPALCRWRQAAHYAARQLTGQSLPRIGRGFQRDHTTILFSCRRVSSRIEKDPAEVAAVQMLMDEARRLAGVAAC
jgi:chromosomal replication initiation ATPase DnaA